MTIKVWKKYTWEQVAKLEKHTSFIHAIAIDDDYFYSGSWDKTIRVWKKDTWEEVAMFYQSNVVTAIVVDEKYIYSGSGNTIQVQMKYTWKEK